MRNKGFTLVEIMIVVAIIALLAAIAIPNLLRARLQANETAAQAALKTIATAEVTFRSANPSYSPLGVLDDPTPPYIDSVLAAGTKNGYVFTTNSVGNEQFCAAAEPITDNVSGVRSFCITEDGVVRADTTGTTPSDRAACLAAPFAPTQP